MKNIVWKDETWGRNGAKLRLIQKCRFFIYLGPIIIFCALNTEHHVDTWPFLIMTLYAFYYALYKSIFVRNALPKVKNQLVNVSKNETSFVFQCYFGEEQIIHNDQLASLEKCAYGFWYLLFSCLSRISPNYCLTTKNGQKFEL